jgi:hypothetical protein
VDAPPPPDAPGFGANDKEPDWLAVRRACLEDAARAAVRAILRASERNRPKAASGFIALDSFPRFYPDTAGVACSARFRVEIREIVPFGAY